MPINAEHASSENTYSASGKLQTGLWWTTASLLMLGICFHFAMVACTLLPSSPLQAALNTVSWRYVNPYFSQNWSFFAPTPVDKTDSLVVHARYVDRVSGSLQETPWFDVDEPLIEQLRRSRTSPLALVQLGLSNTVIGYVNMVSQDPRSFTLDKDKNKTFKTPLPAEIDPLERGALTRAAMSSLAIQYPGRQFTQIQIGILVHTFPRFVQRADPDSTAQDGLLITDWQMAFPVPPFCCRTDPRYANVQR